MTSNAEAACTFSCGQTAAYRFVDRPNRFIVRCRNDRGELIEAFLPNPGRLWELLLPGVRLLVSAQTPPSSRSTGQKRTPRKTKHTVLAVEHDGVPILLDTHRTNRVAAFLLQNRLIPSLRSAEIVRAEVPVGRSRFDFLLEERGQPLYLEVKSCTLFGDEVAMFPDAITERGRRHLVELQELSKTGVRAAVLFVVHKGGMRYFMPDYHTDLEFSRTLLEVRQNVQILAVGVSWNDDLSLAGDVGEVCIPWTYLEREVRDRGSYILIVPVDRRRRIGIGALGVRTFERGYYLYVGSGMRNLSARITRHQRSRKTSRWHIDHLLGQTRVAAALPIRCSRRRECDISEALSAVFIEGPRRFGSSDCSCRTHLYYSQEPPLRLRRFHDLLQRFRMAAPDC
ncbi:DNA/RNA nuclease SfsA [Planctomycetota bacterium]